MRRICVMDEREVNKGGGKYHPLIDARRIHVLEPGVRISGARIAADLLVPFFRAGIDRADQLFANTGVPGFTRIFPLIRVSETDFTITYENQAIGIAVEMRFCEGLLILRNILVPDFRRLIDVTVAIEDGKTLRS